jgi:formylglycine-generating enzyme required for sulfatase activity
MDLAGNVREWTNDRYDLYRAPFIPPSAGSRISVRGSSWRTYSEDAISRSWSEADTRADDLGFRCGK